MGEEPGSSNGLRVITARPEALSEPQRLADRRSQLAVAHGGPAADDRRHGPAGHAHAGERRPAAFRFQPAFLDDALCLQVDQSEIGIVAERDAALAEPAE